MIPEKRIKYKSLIYPLLLMVLIFVESSIPMDGGSDNIQFLTNLDPAIQNLLHIPLYGLLAFLWLNYFSATGQGIKRIILLSLIITISYGCLDEIHQTFVRGRYGGLLDIYLNSAGAILGAIFFIKQWSYSKKSK